MVSGQAEIDPAILYSYEAAFKDELLRLIRRTNDAALRTQPEDMVNCPVRDRSGRCRGFAEYIYCHRALENGSPALLVKWAFRRGAPMTKSVRTELRSTVP